jgi:pantoate--beta-alanine ligase
MHEFTTTAELRAWLAEARLVGHRIALVPTMGALHAGHLSLVDEAKRQADVVVMTVFVNPLQFGPNEDFERYPRDLARDLSLAHGRGVDVVFAPSVNTMYPPGSEIRVVPGATAERLEGAVRPGHFAGVLTVVSKLFHLVEPDVAVFGQKDIQQATLIRQLVRDLDFPIEIIVSPTVREADGMALSSRNAYLSSEDRAQGLGLSAALRAADIAWRDGEQDAARLVGVMQDQLRQFPGVRPDYVEVVDWDRLTPVTTAGVGTILTVAGRVGQTRLLDNHILGRTFE